jgi:DNA-binding response OmpR family regulator
MVTDLDLCKQLKETTSTRSYSRCPNVCPRHISSMEGADDFIAKPFDVDDLLVERIERQLQCVKIAGRNTSLLKIQTGPEISSRACCNLLIQDYKRASKASA